MLRLRFVPEGDEDDDVDIDFLKSVEEQIRTKLKVRVRVHDIGGGVDWFMSHHWTHRSMERAITHPSWHTHPKTPYLHRSMITHRSSHTHTYLKKHTPPMNFLKVSGYDKVLKVYGLTDDIKTWTPEAGFQDRKEPYFVTHGVNMMEVWG